MEYRVNEIFSSIQGEGCGIGFPVVFIRLSGCNLKCSFCDTDFSDYKVMTTAEILAEVNRVATGTGVVITGGEPTIQDLDDLTSALIDTGRYSISIETNGTNPIPECVQERCWITCSPKPPLYATAHGLRPDEMKFVVSKDNIDEIREELSSSYSYGMALMNDVEGTVWLQPEGSDWKNNIKICYDLANEFGQASMNVRVGIQLHKIINEVCDFEIQ